jgi:hypothetical protein
MPVRRLSKVAVVQNCLVALGMLACFVGPARADFGDLLFKV